MYMVNSPFFPLPDKGKHQPYAEGYQVGKNCIVHMVNGVGKNSANLNLSRICIKPKVAVRGWGKTGPTHSFPTLTKLNINLVQKLSGGEKLLCIWLVVC